MKMRVARAVKIVLLVLMGSVLFGFIVMGLWNWLMPPLFGLHLITFWQALGLLLLSKLLFGGFRGAGGHRRQWRQRMRERWEQMPPDEREKFRQGMKARCGGFVPPAEPQV